MCHKSGTSKDSTINDFNAKCHKQASKCFAVSSLAKRAKEANLDAIHDTVYEMARDEARHGKAFAGLLKRYFG